ncbi:MAG: hypothetical protein JOZ90_05145 [Alphaproteobacteria bacterium]|nr:hypothetical protein [Alphaproteobacteria bacterium]MBV9372838.1 hypothetical protein [Alphaproteobacteria bacterium]MBV9900467.1 hypothetical protein [Alphaproteobacteria bacterium]
MRTLLLAAAALAATPAGAKPVESLSFETGPCFGACPVYKVTVRSDGTGVFEGRRFTSVTGTRTFRLTAAQYRAFAAHLAPLRPARGSRRLEGDACRSMATDLPSAQIVWSRPGAAPQSLYFYFGCDMERNRALALRIETAPRLLPIARFIRDPAAPPPAGR